MHRQHQTSEQLLLVTPLHPDAPTFMWGEKKVIKSFIVMNYLSAACLSCLLFIEMNRHQCLPGRNEIHLKTDGLFRQ